MAQPVAGWRGNQLTACPAAAAAEADGSPAVEVSSHAVGTRCVLWTAPAERTGRLFVLLCVGNTALLCGCRLWRLGKQLSTQLATSEKKNKQG